LDKPYTRGGAEVVFGNIVSELARAGHDIFVITTDKVNKIETIDGVKIYRLKPFNIFSFIDINTQPVWKRVVWQILDVFSFSTYFKVKRILEQEKPVLVLSHNLKGLGYLTLKAIKRLKIKNIHTLHDIQLVNASGLMYKGKENDWLNVGLLAKIYSFFTRHIIDSPDVVISPSTWLMDYYTQKSFFPESKKVILPNPVVIDKNAMLRDPQHDIITYLYLGQLETHKGIELLLGTWQKFGKGKLLVAGRGSLEQALKQKYSADKSIEFLGYINYADLDKIFVQVNYTIVPSLCYENSPTVIYDSFKFGVPVIAAEIGGVAELVKDGFNGYSFIAGDSNSLLNKLNLSYGQADNWLNLGNNGKIEIEKYEISNYLDKLLSLIKQ